MKKILLTISLLVFTCNLFANDQQKLQELFTTKINEVTDIVADKGLSKQDRN